MTARSSSSPSPSPTRPSSSTSPMLSSSSSSSSSNNPSGEDSTGLVPATSSSWAALLTTGARGERESLFGYLQGLTSSPRVTDEEQRERERLYRRLAKRQRRAHLRGPSPSSRSGGSHQEREMENESGGGLCGTHPDVARERKRQRTKAPGAKERSETTEAWMTSAASDHHGGIDHPRYHPQPRPFVRSWTNTNSSPSPPPPSFHDPGFYAPSSSSSSLPRLPTIAPSFAQMSPLEHEIRGHHHPPPPHPWSPAASTPYLGSYPPYASGPGSDQQPRSVEAAASPGPDHAHYFPPSPYSRQDHNYTHHPSWDHLAQRHQDHHLYHHPALPPYQAGASALPTSSRPSNLPPSASSAAATSTTAVALGRDPVACLEWDCALEDPPLEDLTATTPLGHEPQQPLPQQQYHQLHHHQHQIRQQQQQAYYRQYPEPSANASDAAVASKSYASRLGHQEEATVIPSAEICRTPPNVTTTESPPGRAVALVGDGRGPRLSPGGLADLLLLYPESARLALQTRAQLRPTPTVTSIATATSSSSSSPMSAAAAPTTLPALGVSVPSPLFAWFAGGHINNNQI